MSNVSALARQLEAEGPKPVYIVQGSERLMVDEAVQAILEAAVDDPRDTLAVTRVDLAESGVGAREILGACNAISLFGDRTAVLVRAAEALDVDRREADREQLIAYATAPNPRTTLVLVATKLRGNTKLTNRFKKQGAVLTFDALRQGDVPGWLMDEARRLGHELQIPTARLIADLVGASLGQLRLVMEQLSLFVGPDAPITDGDVERNLAATRAHTIFELVDAVGQRQATAALRHLHAMLEHREPALKIMAMLVRHFRLLWQVGQARAEGESQQEIGSELRLHPFQAKKFWSQSQRFDRFSLRNAYELLYRADSDLKSSGHDEAIVLERLVVGLAEGG